MRVSSRMELGLLVPVVAKNRPCLHPKVLCNIRLYFSYQVRVASRVEQGTLVPVVAVNSPSFAS